MKDEKTKQKEKQLIEMVSSFCEEKLSEEYKTLCVNLVEKLGRKHDVPFKRGKLENWASGIIYSIAQNNFLFDKSQELNTSPDEICDYFNTKKSTASNKARDIRDMVNMRPFDEEFSSQNMLNHAPKLYMDKKTGLIIPEEFIESKSVEDIFDEACELFEKGKSDKALELLDNIPENSPDYSRALFYKSIINNDEDLALNNDNTDIQELCKEGIYCYGIGDFENAIRFFNMMLGLKPEYDEAIYYKSLCLARLEKFEDALDLINKAIKINPNDDRYFNDKGNYLSRLGRFDESQESFDQAIKLNPTDHIIWCNKAFLYLECDEDEKALECYDKALELKPNEIHPLIGKSNVYMIRKDLKSAKECFDLAREIDENDLEYLMNYGHFMIMQKKYEKALEIWDHCLEIEKNIADIWVYKAMAYMGLENEEMVEKCINQAYAINPRIMNSINGVINTE